MNEFQQLAAEQVSNEQSQSQPVTGQEAQPVQNVPVTPVQAPVTPPVNQGTQASQVPETIPYNRFQDVVSQKNQALAERDALAQYVESIQSEATQSEAPNGVNTVDDLMATVSKTVQSELAPVKQYVSDAKFSNVVESYFANSPDKIGLRQDMANYANNMSPASQQVIKDSIANGETQWLDMMYSTVAASKYNQSTQAVNQGQRSQINQAAQAPNFRSYKPIEESFGDKVQALAQAPDNPGAKNNAAMDVMKDMFRAAS